MCAQVLVADDNPRQAEVVRRYLTAGGHQTLYLTKPYSPRELMARVRTLLRRASRGAAGAAGATETHAAHPWPNKIGTRLCPGHAG